MAISIQSAINYFSGLRNSSPYNLMIPLVIALLTGVLIIKNKLAQ